MCLLNLLGLLLLTSQKANERTIDKDNSHAPLLHRDLSQRLIYFLES